MDFVDIGAAQSFPAAMQQLEARAGEPITLEGFVTHEASAPPDEIVLTRYIVTCCVADATIAQVRIVGLPARRLPGRRVAQVTGAVYPVGREVLVAADSARSRSRCRSSPTSRRRPTPRQSGSRYERPERRTTPSRSSPPSAS